MHGVLKMNVDLKDLNRKILQVNVRGTKEMKIK